MTMTKTEIVDLLKEHIGIPKIECVRIVESFFGIIKSELEMGKPVMISGFSRWNVKAKWERKGRNPQTGEGMSIRARNVVTFKPSAVLKDALNP